jgi:hypothetical protein
MKGKVESRRQMPLFFAQETNLHQNTDGVNCITYSMGVHWEEGGKKRNWWLAPVASLRATEERTYSTLAGIPVLYPNCQHSR